MNYFSEAELYKWLWEVLILEEQAEELFDGQADQLEQYPRTQAKLEYEAICARSNRKILSIRLHQLGVDTDLFTHNIDDLTQVSPGLLKMCMSYNAQEGMLALLILAQIEIMALKVIAKAAEVLDDEDTREMSESILEQLDRRELWMTEVIKELRHSELTHQAA